ncbi:hypothetical protein LN042_11440 [Kitasatospora sp. RB6PN24]|uniref:hypothetical protein n=1 Tax=Kitasatospora humi TaxID=2893891 RepID=UPI001E430B7A|nr:hypothetical protein [Kitasatospora humi]MCC9307702.1 hypothetical protein [Kitasatospora humi]
MADEEDFETEALAMVIRESYDMLAAACLRLPIPVQLPDTEQRIADKMAAVVRLVDLTEDQPMPDMQRAALGVAALSWITVVDMIAMGITRHSDARCLAGLLAFHHLEDAIEQLQEWLDDNS